MSGECSVIWEEAKGLNASMSRNDELEEKMCSWEKERTDLMKQISESREEIRGYERRSSEMETLAMNLKQALDSVEASREMVREVLNRKIQLRVLWKESTEQRDELKEQLDKSKLKIEALEEIMRTASFEVKDQQLQIVKLNETIEKLKMEKNELVARLHIATCKVEAVSTELKADKAKLEALSTEHEAAKAKLEDEKNELNAKLQIANESADQFQQKLLRQEYHFI